MYKLYGIDDEIDEKKPSTTSRFKLYGIDDRPVEAPSETAPQMSVETKATKIKAVPDVFRQSLQQERRQSIRPEVVEQEYFNRMSSPFEPTTASPLPALTFFDKVKEIKNDPIKLIPFVSGGAEAAKFYNLVTSANRLKDNKENADDVKLLQSYVAESKQEKTFGFKVADVLSNLIPFGSEILLTSGLGAVVKQSALKGGKEMLKSLLTKQGEKVLEKKLVKFGLKAGAEIVGRTAQTPIAGATHIWASTEQKQLNSTLNQFQTNEPKESIGRSLAKSFGEQWVETVSEYSGGLLSGANKIVGNNLAKVALFSAFKKANPLKSPAILKTIVERAGWNGLIGEMFEERVGDVAHGILNKLGLSDQKFALPSGEQLAVEFVSFSILGIGIGAANSLLEKYSPPGSDGMTIQDTEPEVIDFSQPGTITKPTKKTTISTPKPTVKTAPEVKIGAVATAEPGEAKTAYKSPEGSIERGTDLSQLPSILTKGLLPDEEGKVFMAETRDGINQAIDYEKLQSNPEGIRLILSEDVQGLPSLDADKLVSSGDVVVSETVSPDMVKGIVVRPDLLDEAQKIVEASGRDIPIYTEEVTKPVAKEGEINKTIEDKVGKILGNISELNDKKLTDLRTKIRSRQDTATSEVLVKVLDQAEQRVQAEIDRRTPKYSEAEIQAEVTKMKAEKKANNYDDAEKFLKEAGIPDTTKSINWIKNILGDGSKDEETIRKSINVLKDGKQNPNSQKAFEIVTGKKLPATQKAAQEMLEEIAGLSKQERRWMTEKEVEDFVNANKGKMVIIDANKRDWQAGHETHTINPVLSKLVGMYGNRVEYTRGKGAFSKPVSNIRDFVIDGKSVIGDVKNEEYAKTVVEKPKKKPITEEIVKPKKQKAAVLTATKDGLVLEVVEPKGVEMTDERLRGLIKTMKDTSPSGANSDPAKYQDTQSALEKVFDIHGSAKLFIKLPPEIYTQISPDTITELRVTYKGLSPDRFPAVSPVDSTLPQPVLDYIKEKYDADIPQILNGRFDIEKTAKEWRLIGENGIYSTLKVQRDVAKPLVKPLFDKSSLKTLYQNDAEFAANPELTVADGMVKDQPAKYLEFRGENTSFRIRASALGLREEGMVAGDVVRFDPASLKVKGEEVRINKRVGGQSAGGYASTGTASIGEYTKGGAERIGDYETDAEAKAQGLSEYKNFKLYEKVQDLIKKYAKTVGQGYTPRGALGVFYTDTENIRVNGMNDLSVASHEITHFLDKTYDISSKVQGIKGYAKNGNPIYDRESAPIRKEMTDIYTKFYPGGKAKHKLKKRMTEGFATLLQKYAQSPKAITAEFPNLVKEFLQPGGKYYVPVMGDIIKDLRGIVSDYQGLSELDKISSRIVDGTVNINKEDWLNVNDKIFTQTADDIFPAEKLAKMTGTVFTAKDPSLILRQYRRVKTLIANNIQGNRGYWGWRNGEIIKIHDFNWKTLFSQLVDEKNTRDFNAFLIARREHFAFKEFEELKDLLEPGMVGDQELLDRAKNLQQILRNDGFTKEEVDTAYEQNKERFAEETEMFDALVQSDLDFQKDVGLITSEEHERLSAQEGYASMKREFYDEIVGEEELPPSIRVGKIRISSMIKRKGSQRPIISPLASSIANHSEITKKGVRQMVYNSFANIADKAPALFQKLQLQAVPDGMGRMLFPQEKDPNIIMSRKDGKRIPFLVDKTVKQVIDDVLTPENFGFFESLFMGGSRVFTKGTTGLYPAFAIVNTLRDWLSAIGLTRNKFIPLYDPLRALSKALIQKDSTSHRYYEEAMILGLERLTMMRWQDMPPKELAAKLRNEKAGLKKLEGWVEKGFDILSAPSQWSELGSRYAEYAKAREAGKPAIVAIEEAGRVTLPFHHKGRLGGSKMLQVTIKSIPFFNPGIQALAQTYRTFMGNGGIDTKKARQRLAFVFMAVTAAEIASFGLLAAAGDDDQKNAYKDMEGREIADAIYLPNPKGKTLIRVPVPNMFSFLGAMINMAIAQGALGAKYKIGDYIAAGTSYLPQQLNLTRPIEAFFSWLPQLIKPGILAALNQQDYPRIRPLEGQSQTVKTPAMRFTEWTSPFAKKLGQAINMSPIKIDYLLTGQFGRATGFVTGKPGAFDALKGINRSYIFERGRSVQNFYDLKKKNDAQYHDFKNGLLEYPEKKLDGILTIHEQTKVIDKLLDVYRDIDVEESPTEAAELRKEILGLIDELNE